MAKRRTRGRRHPRRTTKKAEAARPKIGPRRLTPDEQAAATRREREIFEAKRRDAARKAALELDHVDGAILKYLIQTPAITQEEIGDFIGLTRQTINERMNAPKFKRAIAEANRPALEIFTGNKAAAARKLGALIHSADERVAVRAAVAHLWDMIHPGDASQTGQDFVRFLEEAYERGEETLTAEKVVQGQAGSGNSPLSPVPGL